MISTDFLRTMARYNSWQNTAIYGAADRIGDAERRRDRGAFFGSIHATLNHLLWADQMWMSRFADVAAPAGGIAVSTDLHQDWAALVAARRGLDRVIEEWSENLSPEWLAGEVTWYSNLLQKTSSRKADILVMHFFNHQTHHRGQVHAMLTAAGAETQATDLFLMPAAG